jgi:hypothetical protein
MLYQVQAGPCERSFGIHVCEAVQFPMAVVQRAKRKSHEFELATSLRTLCGRTKHECRWVGAATDRKDYGDIQIKGDCVGQIRALPCEIQISTPISTNIDTGSSEHYSQSKSVEFIESDNRGDFISPSARTLIHAIGKTSRPAVYCLPCDAPPLPTSVDAIEMLNARSAPTAKTKHDFVEPAKCSSLFYPTEAQLLSLALHNRMQVEEFLAQLKRITELSGDQDGEEGQLEYLREACREFFFKFEHSSPI